MRRMRAERGDTAPSILMRRAATPPEVTLLLRAGLVLLLVGAVFVVFLIDQEGLRDNIDGDVSLSDVFYFTMVTITTVGYGDIVPVSDQARLIDAFFVTPVRICARSGSVVTFASPVTVMRGTTRMLPVSCAVAGAHTSNAAATGSTQRFTNMTNLI